MYLIGLNFRGFFLVVFAVWLFFFRQRASILISIKIIWLFWPQTSSFSFERDFRLQHRYVYYATNVVNFQLEFVRPIFSQQLKIFSSQLKEILSLTLNFNRHLMQARFPILGTRLINQITYKISRIHCRQNLDNFWKGFKS